MAGVEIRLMSLAVLARVFLQEVVGQQQNVGLPLAERRDEDSEDVEPVVKVFAKHAVGDGLLEVFVGAPRSGARLT